MTNPIWDVINAFKKASSMTISVEDSFNILGIEKTADVMAIEEAAKKLQQNEKTKTAYFVALNYALGRRR